MDKWKWILVIVIVLGLWWIMSTPNKPVTTSTTPTPTPIQMTPLPAPTPIQGGVYKEAFLEGCLDGNEVSYVMCDCLYTYMVNEYGLNEMITMGDDLENGIEPDSQVWINEAIACQEHLWALTTPYKALGDLWGAMKAYENTIKNTTLLQQRIYL